MREIKKVIHKHKEECNEFKNKCKMMIISRYNSNINYLINDLFVN